MKSKLLIGALCVAALLLVAPTAHAQISVETGKIAKGVTKTWKFTTDTSGIFEFDAVAFDENTDLDIMITIPDGDDDDNDPDVIAYSFSAVTQVERAVASVPGATEVTIALINLEDGRFTRFSLTAVELSGSSNARFPSGPALTYTGEFGSNDAPTNPEQRSLQRLIRARSVQK